jgi:hypothetical protein
MVGVPSPTLWLGAGTFINISIQPTGQAATLKTVGTRVLLALFRGPDA